VGIKTVKVPVCDVCGQMWLPDKRLPDGSHNPAFDNPELCKRCGKCKTPRWNYKAREAAIKERKRALAEEVSKRNKSRRRANLMRAEAA